MRLALALALSLGLGCAPARALDVVAPSSVAGRFISLYLQNAFIGPQSKAVNVSGDLTFFTTTSFDPLPLPAAVCAQAAGKVCVIRNLGNHVWPFATEENVIVAFQECGAKATIKGMQGPFHDDRPRTSVTFRFFVRDADCCRGSHRVRIPATVAWDVDLDELREVAESGVNVTVDIPTLQDSPWAEMYESLAFQILMRGLLGTVNFLACVEAVCALRKRHVLGWQCGASKEPMSATLQRTHLLLVLGLVVELVCCSLRAVYFALGPVLCNGFFTFEQHLFLGVIGAPVAGQVLVLAICLVLFHRWGGFGRQRRERLQAVVLLAFVAMSISMVLGEYSVTMRQKRIFLQLIHVLAATCLLVVSVLFLWFGSRFVRNLRGTTREVRDAQTMQARATTIKAIMFIMLSSVAQILELIAFAVATRDEWLFDPYGWFALWFLFHFAGTLASLCHVYAFTPGEASQSRFIMWLLRAVPSWRSSVVAACPPPQSRVDDDAIAL